MFCAAKQLLESMFPCFWKRFSLTVDKIAGTRVLANCTFENAEGVYRRYQRWQLAARRGNSAVASREFLWKRGPITDDVRVMNT